MTTTATMETAMTHQLLIRYASPETTPARHGHGGVGMHVPAVQPRLADDYWLITSNDVQTLRSHVARALKDNDLNDYSLTSW